MFPMLPIHFPYSPTNEKQWKFRIDGSFLFPAKVNTYSYLFWDLMDLRKKTSGLGDYHTKMADIWMKQEPAVYAPQPPPTYMAVLSQRIDPHFFDKKDEKMSIQEDNKMSIFTAKMIQ